MQESHLESDFQIVRTGERNETSVYLFNSSVKSKIRIAHVERVLIEFAGCD
jgi:hypothetical protein